MTNQRTRIPQYRLHKGTGQAVVTLQGRDIYLGNHGTEASKEKYRRVIAEFVSGGMPAVQRHYRPLTVRELTDRYLAMLEDSRSEEWLHNNLPRHERAIAALTQLYGHSPVGDFGPKALQLVRDTMVRAGLARTTINTRVTILKSIVAWGVAEELLPPSAHHAVSAVAGLRRGNTRAKEGRRVVPVTETEMRAVLGHVAPQIAGLIQFQWFTGCRPSEAVALRGKDLDRSRDIWLYRPARHKSERHGRDRVIWVGRRAQQVLLPFLLASPEDYVFSPREAEAWRKKQMAASRKSKVPPSQVRRAEEHRLNPKRRHGESYTVNTYRQAIVRACAKLKMEPWSPNQLRHAAATKIRKELGIEAARVVLGHHSASVTEIYAQMDVDAALRAIERLG